MLHEEHSQLGLSLVSSLLLCSGISFSLPQWGWGGGVPRMHPVSHRLRTSLSFFWKMYLPGSVLILSPSSCVWPSSSSSPMCLVWPGWVCLVSRQCLCSCSTTYGPPVRSSSHRRPTAPRVWSRSVWTCGNTVLSPLPLPAGFVHLFVHAWTLVITGTSF